MQFQSHLSVCTTCQHVHVLDIICIIMCNNFRDIDCRFGSRVRRKTKFYTHLEDESNGAEGSADRGKRKRAKVASVVRKLQFEPQQPKIPLVAAPPDVPQALVGEKSCEGRQGEGEAREDVIVKVEKEICSNGKVYICSRVGRI